MTPINNTTNTHQIEKDTIHNAAITQQTNTKQSIEREHNKTITPQTKTTKIEKP